MMLINGQGKTLRTKGDLITLYQDLVLIRTAALTNDEINAAWIMASGVVSEDSIKEKYREQLKA